MYWMSEIGHSLFSFAHGLAFELKGIPFSDLLCAPVTIIIIYNFDTLEGTANHEFLGWKIALIFFVTRSSEETKKKKFPKSFGTLCFSVRFHFCPVLFRGLLFPHAACRTIILFIYVWSIVGAAEREREREREREVDRCCWLPTKWDNPLQGHTRKKKSLTFWVHFLGKWWTLGWRKVELNIWWPQIVFELKFWKQKRIENGKKGKRLFCSFRSGKK